MALPSIVGMDGTRHRKLGGLVRQAFTPRMVEQMAPRLTALATELLDAALARGRFDAIQDFAIHFPFESSPRCWESRWRTWRPFGAGPRR